MNEQWIALIEYSSYRSRFPESIPRKTGVEKLCQATDRQNGWIFSNDNREESLIVSFSNAVFINEICIYENLNPGSVIRLEMLESRRSRFTAGILIRNFIVRLDHWWTMWQRKSPTKKMELNQQIFRPILRRYHLQSKTIRVTFDPRYTDQIGIQAISK